MDNKKKTVLAKVKVFENQNLTIFKDENSEEFLLALSRNKPEPVASHSNWPKHRAQKQPKQKSAIEHLPERSSENLSDFPLNDERHCKKPEHKSHYFTDDHLMDDDSEEFPLRKKDKSRDKKPVKKCHEHFHAQFAHSKEKCNCQCKCCRCSAMARSTPSLAAAARKKSSSSSGGSSTLSIDQWMEDAVTSQMNDASFKADSFAIADESDAASERPLEFHSIDKSGVKPVIERLRSKQKSQPENRAKDKIKAEARPNRATVNKLDGIKRMTRSVDDFNHQMTANYVGHQLQPGGAKYRSPRW